MSEKQISLAGCTDAALALLAEAFWPQPQESRRALRPLFHPAARVVERELRRRKARSESPAAGVPLPALSITIPGRLDSECVTCAAYFLARLSIGLRARERQAGACASPESLGTVAQARGIGDAVLAALGINADTVTGLLLAMRDELKAANAKLDALAPEALAEAYSLAEAVLGALGLSAEKIAELIRAAGEAVKAASAELDLPAAPSRRAPWMN